MSIPHPAAASKGSAASVGADLVTTLLPLLERSLSPEFNVFDVMHHGTHEKQLSNVFRWLLEVGGTHGFAGFGQRTFIGLVNQQRSADERLPLAQYSVRQEVNTGDVDDDLDIADIVLSTDSTVIVIENYGVSDGHGHGYDRYLRFAQRGGTRAAVVLLCAAEDRTRLRDGWEHATVVTYESFLDALLTAVLEDRTYAAQHPDQYAFLSQIHRKFATGREHMSRRDALEFVTAMCTTGAAGRYQERNADVAAERFASDVAQQAREQFTQGRAVLQSIKASLRAYGETVIRPQVNDMLGYERISRVTATFSGLYQWTVNFELTDISTESELSRIQIKFGPSAWFANERDPSWQSTIDAQSADYSRLFLTRPSTHEIRQSAVSMQEVLDGLSPSDSRLQRELLQLLEGL